MTRNQIVDRECIYCRVTKPTALFNVEHVIPKAFGTFGPDTFTLDCVCKECNDYFGKNLEGFFNRGSFEGYERYRKGLKSFTKAHELNNRILFRIDYGKYRQIAVKLRSSNDSEPHYDLVEQVGLFSKTLQAFEFFPVSELESDLKLDKDKYILGDGGGIIYVPKGKDAMQRMTAVLSKYGIPFTNKTDIPNHLPNGTEVMVDILGKIDRISDRTIAKIAFNYLTKIHGPAFAMNANFNGIRNFIRYDVNPNHKVISVSTIPILAMDSTRWRQTDAHLITAKAQTFGGRIVSSLSLFNNITYGIVFCTSFSGILLPISDGHFFDWRKKKIGQLTQIPSYLL